MKNYVIVAIATVAFIPILSYLIPAPPPPEPARLYQSAAAAPKPTPSPAPRKLSDAELDADVEFCKPIGELAKSFVRTRLRGIPQERAVQGVKTVADPEDLDGVINLVNRAYNWPLRPPGWKGIPDEEEFGVYIYLECLGVRSELHDKPTR